MTHVARGEIEMSRGLGKVERQILDILTQAHGRKILEHPRYYEELSSIYCLVAGLINELDNDIPHGWKERLSRSCRHSIARALRSLERRGLIRSALIGDHTGGWHHKGHPYRYKVVWLSTVDVSTLPTSIRQAADPAFAIAELAKARAMIGLR
jgi:hypothetical protein